MVVGVTFDKSGVIVRIVSLEAILAGKFVQVTVGFVNIAGCESTIRTVAAETIGSGNAVHFTDAFVRSMSIIDPPSQ